MKKTNVILISLISFLVVSFIASCDVISPSQRGVLVTLGKVEEKIVPAGVKFHAPYVSSIKKFSIVPQTYEVEFSYNADGAITKDMQTVGSTVAVRFAYDENRIYDLVQRYSDSQIKSAMKDNVKASLKEIVGGYSIYDLVEKQNEVTGKVADAVLSRMHDYPITVSQTTITNWDWSDDFDRQVKETANRTQQVKIATQEAEVAAANAQKQVKEAEARKQAIELEAEANLIKVKKEAEAKKTEADAIAYYNAKIAQNQAIESAKWKHEEQMKYYEKWNGNLVPNYIPLTAAGGIVNLSK